MEFRTTFPIHPSGSKIDYNTPVMFIGSCFSSEIGTKMGELRMPVLINPYGTVYNPVSVKDTLENIIDKREFLESDLYNFNGLWISFSHYSNFSAEEPAQVLSKINTANLYAHEFLKKAKFLFVTFGTARVYILSQTGKAVSNCHKLPSSSFITDLPDPEEIAGMWNDTLDKLRKFNPEIRVIFTVSPVRHWKDGAHENQVSKSVLFLAIEKLLSHEIVSTYFPAYELIMDDLRDYRFYKSDMLHPSSEAVDYVWNAFADSFLTPSTRESGKEIANIVKAVNHKFLTSSEKAKKEFAKGMLEKISMAEKKYPGVDLAAEKDYFRNIIQ